MHVWLLSRFRYDVYRLALHMLTFFTVVLASRVPLADKCVTIQPESADKLPVIMLHGLTDIKETWDGIYQSVNFLTGRMVCIYDARNHGDSGWNDTFNVDVLAEDLGNFMEDKEIERASLVGHSMGGLTAMKFTLKNPEKVESIFVEDIAPNSVTKKTGELFRKIFRIILDSLSAIPTDADQETAKTAVTEYFTKITGMSFPEHIFKRFPLRSEDGVWQWKANYEVFLKAFEVDGYFLGELEGQYDGRAFFIYGTASPFQVNIYAASIRKHFPKAELFGVEGSDHNVHVNDTIYIRKLVYFLNEVYQKNTQVLP